MQMILASVDFSDTSRNALSFAAELSSRYATRLVIVNVVQRNEEEREAELKLSSLETELKERFGAGLQCEVFIAHGSLVGVIEKITAAQRPDLVVMGTKGASGLKKILLGSNTVQVISNIKVPALVIPEVARFEQFLHKGKNRIVLATDLDELKNEQALDILKKIALVIPDSKIRVLSVRDKKAELSDSKRAERENLLAYFKPEIPAERVTVFSKGVISGINFYLSQRHEDTGLVAMIARDSGHLIQKHYTREMASHTHLPLLVLHEG